MRERFWQDLIIAQALEHLVKARYKQKRPQGAFQIEYGTARSEQEAQAMAYITLQPEIRTKIAQAMYASIMPDAAERVKAMGSSFPRLCRGKTDEDNKTDKGHEMRPSHRVACYAAWVIVTQWCKGKDCSNDMLPFTALPITAVVEVPRVLVNPGDDDPTRAADEAHYELGEPTKTLLNTVGLYDHFVRRPTCPTAEVATKFSTNSAFATAFDNAKAALTPCKRQDRRAFHTGCVAVMKVLGLWKVFDSPMPGVWPDSDLAIAIVNMFESFATQKGTSTSRDKQHKHRATVQDTKNKLTAKMNAQDESQTAGVLDVKLRVTQLAATVADLGTTLSLCVQSDDAESMKTSIRGVSVFKDDLADFFGSNNEVSSAGVIRRIKHVEETQEHHNGILDNLRKDQQLFVNLVKRAKDFEELQQAMSDPEFAAKVAKQPPKFAPKFAPLRRQREGT